MKHQIKHYLQQPYARIVIPVETNSYHAEILEFPGCYAQGVSPADAYANLEEAAESWISTCLSQGQSVPAPSSNVTYSGHIALRLPRGVHRQAAKLAEREQTSLNTFIVSAVSAKVGAEDFYGALARRFEHQLVQTALWARFHISEPNVAKNTVIQPLRFNKTAANIPARASTGR